MTTTSLYSPNDYMSTGTSSSSSSSFHHTNMMMSANMTHTFHGTKINLGQASRVPYSAANDNALVDGDDGEAPSPIAPPLESLSSIVSGAHGDEVVRGKVDEHDVDELARGAADLLASCRSQQQQQDDNVHPSHHSERK